MEAGGKPPDTLVDGASSLLSAEDPEAGSGCVGNGFGDRLEGSSHTVAAPTSSPPHMPAFPLPHPLPRTLSSSEETESRDGRPFAQVLWATVGVAGGPTVHCMEIAQLL